MLHCKSKSHTGGQPKRNACLQLDLLILHAATHRSTKWDLGQRCSRREQPEEATMDRPLLKRTQQMGQRRMPLYLLCACAAHLVPTGFAKAVESHHDTILSCGIVKSMEQCSKNRSRYGIRCLYRVFLVTARGPDGLRLFFSRAKQRPRQSQRGLRRPKVDIRPEETLQPASMANKLLICNCHALT